MNFDRPILKVTPSGTDILLDRLSMLGLAFIWVFIIAQYSKLPATIPTHFNIKGVADDHGSKATLFILPTIITIIFAGLTVMNKYPHIFNYMQKITVENAKDQYMRATRLIRIIKLIIVVFCVIITIDMIRSAKAGYSKLPWWLIPIFMISMILPIVISVYSFSKKRKK